MSEAFAHQSSAGTSDRVSIDLAIPQALVVTFPWLAVTNAARNDTSPSLEEQFAAFVEEASEWADLNLPLAAEVFDDE